MTEFSVSINCLVKCNSWALYIKGLVIIYGGGGGPRKKWGVGGSVNILMCREWASKKNWVAQSGRLNISFQKKNIAAGAASFICLHYPFILSWNQHNLQICSYRIMSIVLSKSGRRKIIALCRVGRKMFCLQAEWALTNFLVNVNFLRPPPSHK